MSYFLDLPVELQALIRDHLSLPDMTRLSTVSHEMKVLANDHLNWQNRLKTNFPDIYSTLTASDKMTDYKELFIKNYQIEYAEFTPEQRHLFSFVKEGDVESLKKLAVKKRDILSISDTNKLNLLNWAKKNNKQAILNHFFELILNTSDQADSSLMVDPNKADEHGCYLIHWAVVCNQLDYIVTLLAAEANAKVALGIMNLQPLHLAAQAGQLDIVKALVENDLSTLEEPDAWGQTALLWASASGQADVVEYLLEKNPNLEAASTKPNHEHHGKTSLSWAVVQGHTSIVEKLMSKGANAKVALGNLRFQPLHFAAQAGQLDIVKALVENDPSTLEEPDKWGQTALLWASASGQADVVEYLLEKKPNLEAASTSTRPDHKDHGKTSLHWAVQWGHTSTVEKLMAKGANAKVALGNMRYQPLHLAAQAGQLDIVKALVENDPSTLEEPDTLGQTALLWASANGHANVVAYLLEKKPNLEAATTNPDHEHHAKTSLYWAVVHGHTLIVEKLMAKGANAKVALGNRRYQPLHLAAQAGQIDIVKALVENDPSTLEETDAYGQTALLWASASEQADIVKYLFYQAAAGFKTDISKSPNEESHFEKFQSLDTLAQKIISTPKDKQNEQRNDLLEHLKQEAIKAYQQSNVNIDQKRTKLQTMSDTFEKLHEFTERLKEISQEAKSFKCRGYILAATHAETLATNLQFSAETYLKDLSPAAYESFSSSCSNHIQTAKTTLERHRGWKCLLADLAFVISGAGVDYVITGCVNKAPTGKFLFFNKTRSVEKSDALSQTLSDVESPISLGEI